MTYYRPDIILSYFQINSIQKTHLNNFIGLGVVKEHWI